MHRLLNVLAAVALLSGCGVLQDANPLPEKEARCDLRPSKDQCTDLRKFKGPSLVTFQGVCDTLKASLSNGATGYEEGATCPTTDMWGGCQASNGDGSLQTNWFYKGDKYKSVDDAKAECDSSTTWVDPQ